MGAGIDTSKRVLLAALAAALLASPAGARDAWWNFHWKFRRPVTVTDVPRTGLEGEEVGVVTMPTAGLIAPDGRDIRVTTARGQVVPHRVLMIGPGDTARIAFALRLSSAKYYVYFGRGDLPQPGKQLDIRRGVLLETWAYPGGGIANLPRVRRVFARARRLIGRDFRDRIFLGHNPFGPQNRLCNLFTGYLICPANGEYTFATSSRDASFLLIDGKLVVSNGGFHRPQRRASRRGRVRLSKGLHELRLYHVSTAGDPVVMAAWRPPGARRLWTIPADAFAPVRRARPGGIQQFGRAVHVDFLPVHAGETFTANRYFQRYAFQAIVGGAPATRASFQWDFGDGQRAASARCEHVYLRDGLHKVTLTVTIGGRKFTRSNRIYVSRPWDRVTVPELDAVKDHGRIVAGYDFAAADVADLAPAVVLLKRARRTKALLRAGEALVARSSAPAEVLREALPIYAQALVRTAKDPSAAVAALLKGATMTQDPAVGADLTVRAGQVALEAGQNDKALALFRRALKKYSALTTDACIRRARIGIGDVWRLRGDYAKAMAAYSSAAPRKRAGYEKQAVRKGDLARHVEDYLRRGMYNDAEDFLDRLEEEFPTEKLEGYSTLLRVRLALARSQPRLAAQQAEQLVRVNPRSNYAPELLLLAAGAHAKLGQVQAARTALERIVTGYPESPLAAEAARRLKQAAAPPGGRRR